MHENTTYNIYNLEWTGDSGYSVGGFFTFDSDLEGSIVTESDLEDLQLAFFNPSGDLIEVFNYDFPIGGEFNFNFDSATDTVLQSGEFDTPEGFDLGVDFAAGDIGTDFYTSEETIFLEDIIPPGGEGNFISLDEGSVLVAAPRLSTYDIAWEGDDGYSMQGFFSYNAGLEGTVVTEDDLEDMQLAFFEPDNSLLGVFDYDFPISGEFNFNFDSATGEVLQSGDFDSDTGFDLGADATGGEAGIDFYSGDEDFPDELPPGVAVLVDSDSSEDVEETLDQGGEITATVSEPFVQTTSESTTDSESSTSEIPIATEASTSHIYNLEWTGDSGYSVEGFFTFDSDLEGSIVTGHDLNDLQLAFYNPSGDLLEVFNYDFPIGGEFNFNFDSATDTILQSGEFDTPEGFDLGVDFAAGDTGTDFYTSEATIFLENILTPGDGDNSISLDEGGVLTATARLITYDLSWEGDNGYSMQGFFSYNAGLQGSVVTGDDLEDMQLAFFEPDDSLLGVFDYDFPNPDVSGEFNFNFDTVSGEVLQSGEFESDTGFDLGTDFSANEAGVDFFSGDDEFPDLFPGGTIALTDFDPLFPDEDVVLDQGGELIATIAEPFLI